MKRCIPTLTAMLALTLVSVPGAIAGDAQAEPPEILKTAMKLEGKWRANATLSMGDQKYSFVYTLHFRKTADGSGLIMDEYADVGQLGALRGANLIGYDPYEGRLHWFSVDNFGTTHDHITELAGPAHLRLTHQSEREGKPFREVIDMVWRAADQIDARAIATLGGEVVEALEGTFIRAGY